MLPRSDLGRIASFALIAALVAAAVFLPVPSVVAGPLVLALIVGPAARWVVADPVPMSRLTVFAVGAGGVLIAEAAPTGSGDAHPFLIPALWSLPSILAAGALVVGYRVLTRDAPAEVARALGGRWLMHGALVAVALFPCAFVVVATLIAFSGANPNSQDLLGSLIEAPGGVSVTVLVLVAIRWACSRFWVERATGRRKELPCL